MNRHHLIFRSIIFVFSVALFSEMIGINNVSASVVCTKLDNILSYGTNGSEVYSLQKYLNEVGYLKPVANGHFGVGTRDALKKYKEENPEEIETIFIEHSATQQGDDFSIINKEGQQRFTYLSPTDFLKLIQ
jgi:hypothetical protein